MFAWNAFRQALPRVARSSIGSQGSLEQISRSMANHRHKKIIKLTKGYRGRVNCYSVGLRRVWKARQYAYVGRKLKKRDARSLWILRINAGSRIYGMKYNNMIHLMNQSGVQLNRKVCSLSARLRTLEMLIFLLTV
jgi:large subunit ribosomal protein L20